MGAVAGEEEDAVRGQDGVAVPALEAGGEGDAFQPAEGAEAGQLGLDQDGVEAVLVAQGLRVPLVSGGS